MSVRAQTSAKTPAPTVAPPTRGMTLQRKCACGGSNSLAGGCEDCKEKETALQRKAARDRPQIFPARPIVDEVLRSPGHPLDAGARSFMESRFGHDFSRVRVHSDSQAAESARAVNALAYTVGQRVVFDAGQYAPQTQEGRRLIAHELTHTLQQTALAASSPGTMTVTAPQDASEHEADRTADAVMREETASIRSNNRLPISAATADARSSLFRTPKAPATPPQSKAPAHLHACDATTQIPKINKAVTAAKQSATNAVQGLQELLSIWGKPATTSSQMSTARALASAFNIEFDKTDWVQLGIATADEVKALDTRDHAAVKTILSNFKEIEADLPNYASAPGCNLSTGKLSLTSPCFGCADPEYARCKETMLKGPTIAFVLALGMPSSPMFFCPGFFSGSGLDPGDAVLHEAAHIQNLAASDFIGRTSYYGCPVFPQEQFGPGLRDPADFIKIADSYRCFVLTHRETTAAFKEIDKIKQQSKQIVP
jgi:hypothetical protein